LGLEIVHRQANISVQVSL